MVIIWLMMVNNNLVGGFNLPLWKIWVSQLGWWHSQYMEHKIHVPNHQPDLLKNVIYHDLRFPRFGFDSNQYLFGQLQGVQWNVQKMIHPIRRWEFSTWDDGQGCSAALPFFGTALFLKTPWKLNNDGIPSRRPWFTHEISTTLLTWLPRSSTVRCIVQRSATRDGTAKMDLFILRTHEDSEILRGWDQVRYFLFSKLSTGNASLVSCDSKKAHVPRHLSSAISTSSIKSHWFPYLR